MVARSLRIINFQSLLQLEKAIQSKMKYNLPLSTLIHRQLTHRDKLRNWNWKSNKDLRIRKVILRINSNYLCRKTGTRNFSRWTKIWGRCRNRRKKRFKPRKTQQPTSETNVYLQLSKKRFRKSNSNFQISLNEINIFRLATIAS